jgi:ankyrin repeat protein
MSHHPNGVVWGDLSKLGSAVWLGDLAGLQAQLRHGADPSISGVDGVSAVMLAVVKGDLEALSILLDHGASSSLANGNGATPLMLAAERPDPEMLGVLLSRGASASARDVRGRTALSYAARLGRTKCVDVLIAHGSDITISDKEGNTALHLAASQGHAEVVRSLVRAGTDPNAKSMRGHTALHYAAANGHAAAAIELLQNGADPNATTPVGDNPLNIAADHCHRRVALLLVRAGAKDGAVHRRGRFSWQAVVAPAAREQSRSPSWLRAWLARRLIMGGEQRTVGGLVVAVQRGARRRERWFEAISQALKLIARSAPREFARVARYLTAVVVVPAMRPSGSFFGGVCLLDEDLLSWSRDPIEEIALTLVHEATHARLSELGFGRAKGVLRVRIERVCLRAEIDFARRIPGSQRTDLVRLLKREWAGLAYRRKRRFPWPPRQD